MSSTKTPVLPARDNPGAQTVSPPCESARDKAGPRLADRAEVPQLSPRNTAPAMEARDDGRESRTAGSCSASASASASASTSADDGDDDGGMYVPFVLLRTPTDRRFAAASRRG